MADKYYLKAKNEFDPLISELETAGVITNDQQKEAMQQFLNATAQNISTFVNETFTAEHPGETMREATGQRPLTDLEKADKNRGLTTEMIGATFSTWVRGPSEGLLHEHNLTVTGNMAWTHDDAEFRLGQQTYGPLKNPDGSPMLDSQGKQISGDIPPEPHINKQWATDVLNIAQKYVQLQKNGEENANKLLRQAEAERQHAKDVSFLHGEAETRNVGERGDKFTVEMLRKEHENMAQSLEKQAQASIEKGQKDAANLVGQHVHSALHGSALDPDNQQLHHQVQPKDGNDHSHHDHQSNANDAGRHPMSVVLQQVATRDPDAALQLAKQLAAPTAQAAVDQQA